MKMKLDILLGLLSVTMVMGQIAALPEITKMARMAEDSKDKRAAAERIDEEDAMEKSKEKRTDQFPRELTSSLDGKCSNCCACNDSRTIRQRLSKMQAHISSIGLALLMNVGANGQILDELKIIKEMHSEITSLLATTAPPTTTTTPTTTTPMTTMATTNPPTTPKVPEIIKIANGKPGSNTGGTNGGDGSGELPIEAFTGYKGYCTGWNGLDGTDGSYNRPFPHMLWYEFPSFHTPVKFAFKRKYIDHPKTWKFVGSTDENCDQSSNWVDLCGETVGLNTVDYEDVSCDVPEYVGKARKAYKCLGIRILSNNRNGINTGACVSKIKIWEE